MSDTVTDDYGRTVYCEASPGNQRCTSPATVRNDIGLAYCDRCSTEYDKRDEDVDDPRGTLEQLEYHADCNRSFWLHSRRSEEMPDMRHCLDADQRARFEQAYEELYGLPVSWEWPS